MNGKENIIPKLEEYKKEKPFPIETASPFFYL